MFPDGSCSEACYQHILRLSRLSAGSRRRQANLQPTLPLSPIADHSVDGSDAEAGIDPAATHADEFSDAVERQEDLEANAAPEAGAAAGATVLSSLIDETEEEFDRVPDYEAYLRSVASSGQTLGAATSVISPISSADRTILSETAAASSQAALSVQATPSRQGPVMRSSNSSVSAMPTAVGLAAHSTSTEQRRALQAQAIEQRRILAANRGAPRGRGRGVSVLGQGTATPMAQEAPRGRGTDVAVGQKMQEILTSQTAHDISRRAQEISTARANGISPTALFSSPDISAKPSLPISVNAPGSSVTPADSLYSLGLRIATQANVSPVGYSQQFCATLTRLVRDGDSEIVFVDKGNIPRVTSIDSVSIQPDSSLLVSCSLRQLQPPSTFFLPMAQLWLCPRQYIGSPLSSGCSLQPVSSMIGEAVTQCWQVISRGPAPIAPTADPLRQYGDEQAQGIFDRRTSFSSADSAAHFRNGRKGPGDRGDGHNHRRDGGDDDADSGYDMGGRDDDERRGGYYGYRDGGGADRARRADKKDPFKKWSYSQEKIYKGDCFISADLDNVTCAPFRWLDYIARRFQFHNIEKRYWVAAALFAVTKEIQERYKRMCIEAVPLLLRLPNWDNHLEVLHNSEVDFNGDLPSNHPMNWTNVFCVWLNVEFTDSGLVYKQFDFVRQLRQVTGQSTASFNIQYKLQLERLRDLQTSLPEDERERFNSAKWRQYYMRSLLPPVSLTVTKYLREETARQLNALDRGGHGQTFQELMEERQRISFGFDGKSLEQVMNYAESMDRFGGISRGSVGFDEARASTAISRASTAASRERFPGRSFAGSARKQLTQLAIEDDPERTRTSGARLHALDCESEGDCADFDNDLTSPEVFFAQLATKGGGRIWTREQIKKLRDKGLCFRCAKPNCIARTCSNTPANPREVTLNHISLQEPVHVLPEDPDLLDLLVDYDKSLSLNEEAPERQ